MFSALERESHFERLKSVDSQAVSVLRSFLDDPRRTLWLEPQQERDQLAAHFRTPTVDRNALTVLAETRVMDAADFAIVPSELSSLVIENCRNFMIDLSEAVHVVDKTLGDSFAIRIVNCSDFTIFGGRLVQCHNGILLADCRNASISGMQFDLSTGYAITLFDSSRFEISGCRFSDAHASGIYCLGETHHGLVSANRFYNFRSAFNWNAPIHLNHCTDDVRIEDVPYRTHEARRIVEKTRKPNLIFIEGNHFSGNRGQGIYAEGAVRCAFTGNFLGRSNKEGICLDWGTAGCLFASNVLWRNGERAKLSAQDIRDDFIEQYPVLADGSSSCKLPALSVDNGAGNIVAGNEMLENYGGGVKTVRAAHGNVFYANTIENNALGRNDHFTGFAGIGYLSMGAGVREFAESDDKLDFLPSQFNLAFLNRIIVTLRDNAISTDELARGNRSFDNDIRVSG